MNASQDVVNAQTAPAPVRNAPWGYCLFCGKPIYTSFYTIQAVRGRGRTYAARVHCSCYNKRVVQDD